MSLFCAQTEGVKNTKQWPHCMLKHLHLSSEEGSRVVFLVDEVELVCCDRAALATPGGLAGR